MSTDISLVKTSFDVEDRSWLASPHGTEPGTTPGVTLDVSAFTAADHYPNGYIPSGTVVGKITASGKYGPYLGTATDGTETAVGVTFGTVSVYNSDHSVKTDVATSILVHGFVKKGNMPFDSTVTTGGFIDTAGESDLSLIHWED